MKLFSVPWMLSATEKSFNRKPVPNSNCEKRVKFRKCRVQRNVQKNSVRPVKPLPQVQSWMTKSLNPTGTSFFSRSGKSLPRAKSKIAQFVATRSAALTWGVGARVPVGFTKRDQKLVTGIFQNHVLLRIARAFFETFFCRRLRCRFGGSFK